MYFKDLWMNFKSGLKQYDYKWKFKLIVCLSLIAVLLILDWSTKAVVANKMELDQEKEFLPGFLNFHYTLNMGSAFGVNSDSIALTVSMATIITIIGMIAFIFVNDKKWLIPLSLFLAGSLGNLLGRAWAPPNENGEYGGVVDFLVWDFNFLGLTKGYIFNLADVYVNLSVITGVICLIWELVLYIKTKFKKEEE